MVNGCSVTPMCVRRVHSRAVFQYPSMSTKVHRRIHQSSSSKSSKVIPLASHFERLIFSAACTDLGVNSLHRSVPVGLGLGDTVSVGCFTSKPREIVRSSRQSPIHPISSVTPCILLYTAFPSSSLPTNPWRPGCGYHTGHNIRISLTRPIERSTVTSSTHAVWFFDLAILTR